MVHSYAPRPFSNPISAGKTCTRASLNTYVLFCALHFLHLMCNSLDQNVRVVAQYYTRITLPRLTSLLDLTAQQTEDTLARLVVSGTIWARVDRPAQIVNFRSKRSAEDVMNDWSSDMQKLLSLVEKTWMGMNAAQAAQSRVKA
jgi:26S proteasome regulatory subunit N5